MQNLFEGHLLRLRALEPGDAETLFQHRQDTEISEKYGFLDLPLRPSIQTFPLRLS